MKLGAAASEAIRNLKTSTTPLWLVMPLLVGCLASPQAILLDRARALLRTDTESRLLGVYDVDVQGLVDGPICESFAAATRYLGSGAARPGGDVVPLLAPGSSISLVQITPGAAMYFGLPSPADGLVASPAAAAQFARDGAIVTVAGSIAVGAVAPIPDTLNKRDLVLVEIVPPTGDFQHCYVERYPPLKPDSLDLLRAVRTDSVDSAKLVQVNSSRGAPVDFFEALDNLEVRLFVVMSLVAGLLASAAASWIRRRETSLQLHSGVSRPALAMIRLLEATVIVGMAAVVAESFVSRMILNGTTTREISYLVGLASRPLWAGEAGFLLGSIVFPVVVRRRSVLKYLRDV